MPALTVPTTVTSLETLVAFLKAHREDVRAERIDIAALPTFGGEQPRDTQGIYSWDAERLLVGEGSAWEIVPRLVHCECGTVFGGTCESAPDECALMIEIEVMPAQFVGTSRACGTPTGTDKALVSVGCHDAIEALGAECFFDEDREVVIGA